MAQQIKITQTSNADMNIGVPKNLTMAQQTAIQQYIEYLYEIIKISKAEELTPCTLKAILYCIEKAKGKLNMEKEQIVDAYQAGATDMGIIESEQYFNQTYHPNKD
jgi:hypothetical protein